MERCSECSRHVPMTDQRLKERLMVLLHPGTEPDVREKSAKDLWERLRELEAEKAKIQMVMDQHNATQGKVVLTPDQKQTRDLIEQAAEYGTRMQMAEAMVFAFVHMAEFGNVPIGELRTTAEQIVKAMNCDHLVAPMANEKVESDDYFCVTCGTILKSAAGKATEPKSIKQAMADLTKRSCEIAVASKPGDKILFTICRGDEVKREMAFTVSEDDHLIPDKEDVVEENDQADRILAKGKPRVEVGLKGPGVERTVAEGNVCYIFDLEPGTGIPESKAHELARKEWERGGLETAIRMLRNKEPDTWLEVGVPR